jgi:uncharacterized OB-fold protein
VFYRCRQCGRSSARQFDLCPHCMTNSVGKYVCVSMHEQVEHYRLSYPDLTTVIGLKLPMREKFVLFMVTNDAGMDGYKVNISRLCEVTGLSISVVKKTLSSLREKNLILPDHAR